MACDCSVCTTARKLDEAATKLKSAYAAAKAVLVAK